MNATYKLNVKFLAKLLIATIVVCAAVFFLHRYQESRLTSRYLTQANNARDDGKIPAELSYLRQYIQLNPNDNAARVRYGERMAKHSKKPAMLMEAYLILQKALYNEPTLPAELRVQCVKLALRPDVNLPDQAKRDLDVLLKNDGENPEYESLYADALLKTNDFAQAEEYLTKSIARRKNRIEPYSRLAWLKRERSRGAGGSDAADLIIRQMLEQPDNEKNPQAWLRAAGYYRAYNQNKEYKAAVERAVALAPDDSDVVLARAEYDFLQWFKSFPHGTMPKVNADYETALKRLSDGLDKELSKMPPLEPPPEYASSADRALGNIVLMFRQITRASMQAGLYEQGEKRARQAVGIFKDDLPQLQLDLLEVLVAQKKSDEARQIASKLSALNFAPALVELQLGYLAVQELKWVEAARHLERVMTELATFPELHHSAARQLALCYTKTGEDDRKAETLAKAIPSNPLDPTFVSTKLQYADSLVKLGRFSEAMAQYREVGDKEPKALLPLTSLLINEKFNQPAASRDWKEVEKNLAKLPPGSPAEMVHAEYLVAKGDVNAARERLAKAMATDPKSGELVVAAFNLELREKKFDAATAIITKAEAVLGDTAGLRQMKIARLLQASPGDAKNVPELEKLAAGLDKFAPHERLYLYRVLSHAARFANRRDLAWQWLDQVAAINGEEDMDLQYARFDLALLDNDDAKLTKVLDDISRITGKASPSTRLATAFANIFKAERIKDAPQERQRLLASANDLLAGLEGTRKEWGKLYVAQGKIADMLGNRDVAVAKFEKAITHGERQPEIVSRLVDLYYTSNRSADAVRIMTEIPEARSAIQGDSDKMIVMMIAAKNYKGAEDMARQKVPDDSKDAEKLLWRAKVHAAAQRLDESEMVLKKAQALAPDNVNIWLGLVQLLVEKKKVDEAKRFIEANRAKLTAKDAPLAIAQALAAVGDTANATAEFIKLLGQPGENLPLLMASGTYFFKAGDAAKAAPLLERVLKHPGRSPNEEDLARRMFALCTLANRDHKSAVRALEVLGFSSPASATNFKGNETLEDLDCRYAVCSAMKGRDARLASVALLKKFESMVPNLGTDKQLAFGKLLFALGDWPEARRRLSIAANATDASPVTIAPFAHALLRRNEYDEAKKYIDRLVGIDANNLITLELQARHAVWTNNKALAADVMKKYQAMPKADSAVAAAILEELGLPEDAGVIYRKNAEAAKDPGPRLLYARYLARNGRVGEAMTEFEKVWDAAPKDVAVQLLCEAMLYTSESADGAIRSKAEQMVRDAVAKQPDLAMYQSALLSVINKADESITIARAALQRNPNSIYVLNNLAFMLSLKEGRHNEALAMIRKAKEIDGPQPELLDTEAVILMTMGKPAEAIVKLEDVVVDAPSATAYVHLAQAYFATERKNEAILAQREAQKFNMRINDFHPLERQTIRGVVGKLGG